MRNLVSTVITFLIIFGCDPADNRFCFKNNSNIDVYIYYSCDTSLNNLYWYRSGLYWDPLRRDSIYVKSQQYVEKFSSQKIVERGFNAWRGYLKDCKGKIYLYVFPDSIFYMYPLDEIKKRKMYLKRMELTLKELEAKNWTVTFPE